MSKLGTLILGDTYRDSVFLMQLSSKVEKEAGVELASAMSGTDRNKDLFADSGLSTEEVQNALPDDLIIAVRADTEENLAKALKRAEELLKETNKEEAVGERKIERLEQAVEAVEGLNLALISVAGDFAKYEAAKAVNLGLNVMLYSDNVPLEAELKIKEMAHEKGLLVMGPDCGTSIINGVPLAFANEVRRGPIGIVGASGTGIQEVTVLIDRYGGGISHAIGTGGRDPKAEIGGITMLDALQLLQDDPQTEVILIVAKPPAKVVEEKISAFIKACPKAVVVNYAGEADDSTVTPFGGFYGHSLEEAAMLALEKAGVKHEMPELFSDLDCAQLETELKALPATAKYFRGIYGGGSLCYESMFLIKQNLDLPLHSNTPLEGVQALADVHKSVENLFLDMGEDEFTQGKPHPMIDPTTKVRRLIEEAKDPEVAVILTDCVIGYGSYEDPAGMLAEALSELEQKPIVIASVCGTEADFQKHSAQVKKLQEQGVHVCRSNREAALLTVEVMKKLEKERA
ncbi:MAG: acyl-CoA synthetase FdrA [Eubacteriales bacterium]|nr:acyl-CoA synthetase FdrA [Eubacteriales bacterium]